MIRWNDRSKKFNSAIGIHDPSFEYRVEEIIEPKNGFDSNLEEVCASGIHYFLTEEPAYFWEEYIPDNGVFKSWYDNGQIKKKCTYKYGYYDGPYKEYYKNGQIKVECAYKGGDLDGSYKSYYENGRNDVECAFKDGHSDGSYKSYYENGHIKEECIYKDRKKDGNLDGLYKSYYENGIVKSECTYEDGELDGLYKSYYENGIVKSECTYENDMHHGPYTEYHSNGHFRIVCTYKYGEKTDCTKNIMTMVEYIMFIISKTELRSIKKVETITQYDNLFYSNSHNK